MLSQSSETEFRSLDGLRLRGTLVNSTLAPAVQATVLVHGGGVTRDEGGFFTRLAEGLAAAGVPSLRFDLRGHGESEGRQEDLTISGVVNDIRSAVAHAREMTNAASMALIGTSFGGGISGYFAAQYPEQLGCLVLLNPLLNYKRRFIDDKVYWHEDRIGEEAGRQLHDRGFVRHSPTFKLGRAFLNEVFYVQPHRILADIRTPTLFVHGTEDTFIPVESSRAAVKQLAVECKLVEIDGSQHGFAVHDDPQYLHPQSKEWQAFVIVTVTDWVMIHQ